jgi:hypothetical protein
MKNIHIIQTDKPSRLFKNKQSNLYSFRKFEDEPLNNNIQNQNIYIASDEEIKEGDWVLDLEDLAIGKVKDAKDKHNIEIGYDNQGVGLSCNVKCCSEAIKYPIVKIILTTDQDLINDVQAIDNEFLEWFINNSSCEKVEVVSERRNWKEINWITIYKIIIPKEESKQECKDCNKSLEDCTCIEDTVDMKKETLEEAAENYTNNWEEITGLDYENSIPLEVSKIDFIAGAKWNQERSYSEEEVELLLETLSKVVVYQGNDYRLPHYFEYEIKEVIKQFKKK